MVALKKPSPARTDLDWRVAKAQATLASQERFAGFIFVCNNSTIPDLDRQLFGLPARHVETVRAIRRGMPLFLYNYSTRLLHGVFEAASNGGFNLDPHAWENTEMVKIGRAPTSRYPAQVKIHVRAMRPPLDEETFRPVLDHQEGHKFRLELTQQQAKQLLELFGVSDAHSEWEDLDERNMDNLCHHTVLTGDYGEHAQHGSPDFMCKSDSDTCSASDDGGNFCEDEWSDETYFRNANDVEPLNVSLSREYAEGFLSQGSTELAVEEQLGNNGVPVDKSDLNQLGVSTYSAALIAGMHITSQEHGFDEKDGSALFTAALKGNSQRQFQRTRPELSHVLDEDSMLLRLHDADPAVNSSSVNYLQPGTRHVHSSKRQDSLSRSHEFPSQVHSSFTGGENVLFIPISTVKCQQTGLPSFSVPSQRTRWNEPRKSLRHLSGQNSRKQLFNQEKPNRFKDVRSNFRKRNFAFEQQQHASIQTPDFQLGQVLVPLCMQRPVSVQEQGHLTTVMSPVFISPTNPPQHRPGGSREESHELFENGGDSLLHRDGIQSLVQNGQWGLQGPVLLMSSIMQRFPGPSSPMAEVNVEALHYEILEFAKMSRPSPKTRLHAEAAIHCVRNAVRRVWPEADVEVFGSFATGLCLRHSDVDLAVVGAPCPSSTETLSVAQASALLIRELAGALHDYHWCESINVIDTASMPVLKSRCRPTDSDSIAEYSSLPCVAIDITIGGMRNLDSIERSSLMELKPADEFSRTGKFGKKHTGGAAREYVLQKIRDLPALAPLVLLLKSYLYHRCLSDVYSGGLGSFSLTLLLAFYLEKVPVPCELSLDAVPSESPVSPTASSPLSCLEFSEDSDTASSNSGGGSNSEHGVDTNGEYLVRRAADVVDRVLALWHSGGLPYLGTLLLGFLQTFGFELDLSTAKIVLKGADGSPGGIFQRDSTTRHMALWIDDPLRPGVNVGAGSYAMCHVQVAFQEMLQVLTNRQLFISLPQNTEKICSDIPGIGSLYHLNRLFDVNED